MQKIPESIIRFLDENRVSAVCFNNEMHQPYCVNCFFTFDPQHRLFIFKSSEDSYHSDFVRKITHVAGSVLPEKMNLLQLRGIQYTGATLLPAEVEGLGLNAIYYKRFPLGRARRGYFWAIRPDFIKFTDNALGFGHKITWSALALQED